MTTARRDRGFSLLEALVATFIVATAFGALTHLAIMATRANVAAASTTLAALLAAEQADVLSADLAVQGAGAAPLSPSNALQTNSAGYHDFFDARGRPLPPGAAAPAGAAFVRRWSVRPLPAGPADARLLHVVVLPWPQAAGPADAQGRQWELARVVVVKAGPG